MYTEAYALAETRYLLDFKASFICKNTFSKIGKIFTHSVLGKSISDKGQDGFQQNKVWVIELKMFFCTLEGTRHWVVLKHKP